MKLFETSSKGLCSIEIGPEGIAVAYTPRINSSEITICDFQHYANNEQFSNERLSETLTKIVAHHNLKKIRCNWVLHPDYYRLTLIDTPDVPKAEYKQAARWQIKDIISYPLEDVSVDIFYPDELSKSSKKIFVVAAQNSFLQNIANVIQNCGLILVTADIREFAVRNLIANLAKQNETIGFISFMQNNCLIVSIKQSNIQFVRYMPIDIRSNHYDELIKEIQRSFDFCKTELGQELPSRFFILPKDNLDSNLIQNISSSLNKELSIFTLREAVDLKTTSDSQLEANCWVAIGGALRDIS